MDEYDEDDYEDVDPDDASAVTDPLVGDDDDDEDIPVEEEDDEEED